MKTIDQTKLTVQLSQPDKDTFIKQNFSNVVNDPAEAAVLQLGETIAELAPAENQLDSVVETIFYNHTPAAEVIE